MQEHRGLDRGSFLWGRSVHNIRIERLWVDVTNGFGAKWKAFFLQLEVYCALDSCDVGHLWLLHHMFLPKINRDARLWQEVWNQHRLRVPGGGHGSPSQLFYFGMVQHGVRGLDDTPLWSPNDPAFLRPPEEGGGAMYGVDWEEMEDRAVAGHHAESHP
ncbi:hypothetical protein CALCODRAFT_419967, partial [Calocera cornea HHB12733]